MKLSAIFVGLALSTGALASQAVKFYSNGSLENPSSVLQEHTGTVKLFQKRGNNYTTTEMIDVLRESQNFVSEAFPSNGPLQIGDLSAIRGGKLTRHASHQNGLDSDVVYLTKNGAIQSPEASEWGEDFVRGSNPSANFHSERNWKLFTYLVKFHPIDRIFVDQSIKNHYCKLYGKNPSSENARVLRLLRPAANHRTHFHIRLTCPKDDKRCQSQAAIPAGTGCQNKELANELSC